MANQRAVHDAKSVAFASEPVRLPEQTSFLPLTFVAAKYCENFPSLDRKFTRLLLLRCREAEKLVDLLSP
jgi:hypothetical protein